MQSLYVCPLSRVQVPPQLNLQAAAVASVLGVLLPLVSAIVPTLHAMETSVRAALDVGRAGPTVTKLLVSRRSDPAVQWHLVLCGAAAAGLGLTVYYLMPLALLSGSVTMLLDVFFILLIVMLLGLVVVAMNICRLFEQLLLAVLVWWWESKAVYQTAKLNLQAHRQRNRHAQVSRSTSAAHRDGAAGALRSRNQFRCVHFMHSSTAGASTAYQMGSQL